MKARRTIWSSASVIGVAAFTVYFFCSAVSSAQGLYNQANLYVNGAALYVDGDVVNTGRLENEGLVAFTRDWQSAGKYKGDGALQANGNTSQRIQHYNQKANTLMVDGWGTKYLQGEMTVTGTLQLTTGVLHVTPDDVLKLRDGAVVAGGSTDSYVDGALTVEGIGYKFFPVGKNGIYAPIEFLQVQGDAPEFSVEVFDDAHTLSVDDVIVRNGLYWQRKDLSGAFGGSAVAIDFENSHFHDPQKITLLAGTDWNEPFFRITDIEHSAETDKIYTRSIVTAPIIMVGEISDRWTEADFYFSTALSPNASRSENHKVMIFGDRLDDDKFRFQVFNRWGVMVYETTSLDYMQNNGWDGRSITGVALASGIYPYRLTAIDKTGSKFEKAGVITIIH